MEGDTFLSTNNFANLINQGAAIVVLAMGLTFVLLLGEIDLSAGFAAGMGAAILAVTLTEHGWAWPLAILAALATGVLIGLAIGVLVAYLGIPSFVVTLAAFLALQGGDAADHRRGRHDPGARRGRAHRHERQHVGVLGWLLALLVVGGFAGTTYWAILRRRKQGLPAEAVSVWLVKVIALAVPGPRGRLPAQPGAPAGGRADRDRGRAVGRPAHPRR